ncbi:uncharacterized protein [Prorops nasuta]
MRGIRILIVFFLVTIPSLRALVGENVCRKEVNYTVTTRETYNEPVVVNTFTWCLQIPPRCPNTRTEIRERTRIKEEVKWKTVDECCEGYKVEPVVKGPGKWFEIDKIDDWEGKCVPSCEKCLAGVCVSPNKCQCEPGYHGDDCTQSCPRGFWGKLCAQECDCERDVTCDPVNGTCHCPLGLLGPRCEEKCPDGQWGRKCESSCVCMDKFTSCDPETGACIFNDDTTDGSLLDWSEELTTEKQLEIINLTIPLVDENGDKIIVSEGSHEEVENDAVTSTVKPSTKTTVVEIRKTSTLTSNYAQARTEDTTKHSSTTSQPVVVLVSVPERRPLERDFPNFPSKDSFLRQIQSKDALITDPSPKIDYVKTNVQKDSAVGASVSLDIALIVVASIVSLGLTSVAVLMILHIRSKLFETIRLSIYDTEKPKGHEPREDVGTLKRISPIVENGGGRGIEAESIGIVVGGGGGIYDGNNVGNGTLTRATVGVNPLFASCSDPATIFTLDNVDSMNTYANGSTTIGLRISANLRDFLEGHYDKPTATLIRLHSAVDTHNEHIYDEIPLQSPPVSLQQSS